MLGSFFSLIFFDGFDTVILGDFSSESLNKAGSIRRSISFLIAIGSSISVSDFYSPYFSLFLPQSASLAIDLAAFAFAATLVNFSLNSDLAFSKR